MPNLPSDLNVRAVLQKAAAEPAFLVLLINNREAALRGFPLSDAERNMLMSATATQIEKMVEQGRRKSSLPSAASMGCLGAAALVGGATLFSLTATAGIRPEAARAMRAQQALCMIATAEAAYHEKYGTYGTVEDLRKGQFISLPGDAQESPFALEIEVGQDSFRATAHSVGSSGKPAFQVGPDGQVKPLE